ncbi:hypothetical protein ABZ092_00460 [Streptomyces bobili]
MLRARKARDRYDPARASVRGCTGSRRMRA